MLPSLMEHGCDSISPPLDKCFIISWEGRRSCNLKQQHQHTFLLLTIVFYQRNKVKPSGFIRVPPGDALCLHSKVFMCLNADKICTPFHVLGTVSDSVTLIRNTFEDLVSAVVLGSHLTFVICKMGMVISSWLGCPYHNGLICGMLVHSRGSTMMHFFGV